MSRRKGQQTEYSVLFKNHGQKLEEDLRHRVPEDPFYASVDGGIRRIELSLKEIRENTPKQAVSREETRQYGVGAVDQFTLKTLFENSGEIEASFMTNLNKFKQEVESVNSLLTAENDRLTEMRDSMLGQVDGLKERVERMTKQVDRMEKNVERRKVWLKMQREKQQAADKLSNTAMMSTKGY